MNIYTLEGMFKKFLLMGNMIQKISDLNLFWNIVSFILGGLVYVLLRLMIMTYNEWQQSKSVICDVLFSHLEHEWVFSCALQL